MTTPTNTTQIQLAPLCFVDTETTGVHPKREAWEVALIRRDDCVGPRWMVRGGSDPLVLTTWPPKYPHRCANGHVANLTRTYPGHDVLITNEPVPRAIRKRQPPGQGADS